uniref:Uncharacterized protein n=1 Tax=Strigamia maritima TaxID=126957 RepID=T1ISJ5_STRMM
MSLYFERNKSQTRPFQKKVRKRVRVRKKERARIDVRIRIGVRVKVRGTERIRVGFQLQLYDKIQSFDDDDYYGDYQSDSGKDISYSKLRLTTSPPLSLGCPQTHSVCQHYCESKNFYSGYCEGNFCHCYGKL